MYKYIVDGGSLVVKLISWFWMFQHVVKNSSPEPLLMMIFSILLLFFKWGKRQL